MQKSAPRLVPTQPGRGKSLKKKVRAEPLAPLETITEAPVASDDEAGADTPSDEALLQLCVVGPNGDVKVLDRVPVGDDTTTLHRLVGRAMGIPMGELKLVSDITIIPMSAAAKVSGYGLRNGDMLSAFRVIKPRLLWRGYRIHKKVVHRHVQVVSWTKEIHQRLFLTDEGRCYCIAIFRQSAGDDRNGSIHDNSEEIVWSLMGGVYVHRTGANVKCEWDKRPVRTVKIAGRDNFFMAESWGQEDCWNHVHDDWHLEDPAAIEGWPELQAPDDDPDSWCEFDEETLAWMLSDGRTQRVCDNIDERSSIGEHEFLGIRTGSGQYTLYDLQPGAHWNDAFYSNRGFGATDAVQLGDGFVPASPGDPGDPYGMASGATPRGPGEDPWWILSVHRMGWNQYTDQIMRAENTWFRRVRTADRVQPEGMCDDVLYDDCTPEGERGHQRSGRRLDLERSSDGGPDGG